MSQFDDLEQAVGHNMPNLPADVRKVRQWLEQWQTRAGKTLQQDKQAIAQRFHETERDLDRHLQEALQEFQRRVLGDPAPTGNVHPGDKTARKLKHPAGEPPKNPGGGGVPVHPPPGTALVLPKRRGFVPLSADDFAKAATELGCEPRVIHALALQEGKKSGFDKLNHPVILWEPRHFAKYLRRLEPGKKYPALTNYLPAPHRYGLDSQQYPRLDQAYLINPRAALMTPSWGRFQILGENYRQAGYASIESFVDGMCNSEQTQLEAFVEFIKSKHLQKAMKDKDWAAIADGYNGHGTSKRIIHTAHGDTNYAQQLEQKYNELKD